MCLEQCLHIPIDILCLAGLVVHHHHLTTERNDSMIYRYDIEQTPTKSSVRPTPSVMPLEGFQYHESSVAKGNLHNID
jgi:hypothetical protein